MSALFRDSDKPATADSVLNTAQGVCHCRTPCDKCVIYLLCSSLQIICRNPFCRVIRVGLRSFCQRVSGEELNEEYLYILINYGSEPRLNKVPYPPCGVEPCADTCIH